MHNLCHEMHRDIKTGQEHPDKQENNDKDIEE